jgi:hypothetical protein
MTEHDSNLCWCETCYYPEPYTATTPRLLDEDEVMELED